MAEGGGLLNRYMAKAVSWVRIPSPPPFPALKLEKSETILASPRTYPRVYPSLDLSIGGAPRWTTANLDQRGGSFQPHPAAQAREGQALCKKAVAG